MAEAKKLVSAAGSLASEGNTPRLQARLGTDLSQCWPMVLQACYWALGLCCVHLGSSLGGRQLFNLAGHTAPRTPSRGPFKKYEYGKIEREVPIQAGLEGGGLRTFRSSKEIVRGDVARIGSWSSWLRSLEDSLLEWGQWSIAVRKVQSNLDNVHHPLSVVHVSANSSFVLFLQLITMFLDPSLMLKIKVGFKLSSATCVADFLGLRSASCASGRDMVLLKGQSVMLQYLPAGRWEERVVVLPDGKNRYWVVSPDFELFPVILRSPPLVSMRLLPPSRELPASIDESDADMVYGGPDGGFFTDDELDAFETEARALAEVVEPDTPSQEPGTPSSSGQSATAYKGDVPETGNVWVVAMPPPGSRLRIGDILNVPSTMLLESSMAHIPVLGEETKVLCRYLDVTQRQEFARQQLDGVRGLGASGDLQVPGVGEDVRTLAVERRPITGERFRSFGSSVPLFSEQAFDDWPIEGPRATKWLCAEIVKSAPTPIARHHRWLRDADIPGSDRSRFEHSILSDILDKAVSYDALQVSNLASFEILSRRLQHIEMAHLENPQAPDYSGSEFFMGSSERRGGALVAPGLARHVASRLSDDAAVAKEQRKAREARAPGPSAPPPAGPKAPAPGAAGKGKKGGKPKGPGAPGPAWCLSCLMGCMDAVEADMRRALCVGADALYPLHKLAEFTERGHPSRASVRESRLRQEHVVRANFAVDALNYLHGTENVPPTSSTSPAQRSALKHIWESTADAHGDPKVTRFGAARELLQMGRAYGSAQSTKTVPYQEGCVSLPAHGRRPVDFRWLLQGVARRFLEDHQQWLLHDDAQMAEAHDHAASIKPYTDPALRDPRRYHSFVKELFHSGILSWARRVRGRCTPFFVPKKSGALRLVLDCRQLNAYFRVPAACEMGSLAAMCELEVESSEGQTLFVSQADVQDCFWQCQVPHDLALWFGMDVVPGWLLLEWGVDNVEGIPIGTHEFIHPVISCLPMGWSWAMWFVQQLHESVVLQHFPEESILRDGRPAPDVRSGDSCASPYCDNLGVIGVDAEDVLHLRESVQQTFEMNGFRMHEETEAEQDAKILRGRFHGEANIIRPTKQRVDKTRKAFLWLARRPRITGRELERLIGHGVVLSLLSRSSLAFFVMSTLSSKNVMIFVYEYGPQSLRNV